MSSSSFPALLLAGTFAQFADRLALDTITLAATQGGGKLHCAAALCILRVVSLLYHVHHLD